MTETVKQSIACDHCEKVYTFEVRKRGLELWKEGELIQYALPELNDGQRELLISQTCDDCWTEFFGSYGAD